MNTHVMLKPQSVIAGSYQTKENEPYVLCATIGYYFYAMHPAIP